MKLTADPESMRAVTEMITSAEINDTMVDSWATLRGPITIKLTKRQDGQTRQTPM